MLLSIFRKKNIISNQNATNYIPLLLQARVKAQKRKKKLCVSNENQTITIEIVKPRRPISI